jgi:hypothetical protein
MSVSSPSDGSKPVRQAVLAVGLALTGAEAIFPHDADREGQRIDVATGTPAGNFVRMKFNERRQHPLCQA